MLKTCIVCKVAKSPNCFEEHSHYKDGLHISCIECRSKINLWSSASEIKKENNKKYKRKLREDNMKFIWSFLLSHPCVDCGEANPIVLEFDHLHSKVDSISRLSKCKRSVIENEISKCEVRCANCHRRKTSKELGWYRYERSCSERN